MEFDFIVAVDVRWGISRQGNLPWKGTSEGVIDMNWFKKVTSRPETAVIMGRRTWESIPDNFRPLPGRINVVISSRNRGVTIMNALTETPVVNVDSFTKALEWCAEHRVEGSLKVSQCIVIGGNLIYEQALRSAYLRFGFITKFNRDFDCDKEFPIKYLKNVSSEVVSDGHEYTIHKFNFTNEGERAYMDLLRELETAPSHPNRTNIPTQGIFHRSLRFQLHDGRGKVLPLITTKKINWAAIYHELIWFLRGSTNTSYLVENNVKIWNGNSTREYLDAKGLTSYAEGDLGPIYGHQWRNWGGLFQSREPSKGIDQLSNVIEKIKTDPGNRRLVVSAWNVSQLEEMALPPCFLAGTPVRTQNGYEPIETIQLRSKLYTHVGNFKPVNEIHITNYTGPVHLLKVIGQPEPYRMTPNHPMYYRAGNDASWVEAKNISNGRVGIHINTKSILVPFTEIINTQHKKVKTQILLDDVNMWYMLGYFVKNGSIDQKYKSYFIFNLTDMERSFPIISTVTSLNEVATRNYHSYRRFEIREQFWYNIFKEFGRAITNRTIPQWVHDAPVKYIEKFLEGYGYANRSSATTVSRDLAYHMQLLLLKIGKKALISKHDNPHTYSIYYQDSDKSDICVIEAGYAWYKVKSNITVNVENTPVYNFDVGDDHTYTVGNLATHNCHYSFQFHVGFESEVPKYLNCLVNMRSADVALGVPFNIASYSLLTHIIAHLTGLTAGELVVSMADCHLYENHLDGVREQLTRCPRRFPIIQFGPAITSCNPSKLTIDDFAKKFTFRDYIINNYNSHPPIKLHMAV